MSREKMFHVKRFIWTYGKSGAIIEPATQGYMKKYRIS